MAWTVSGNLKGPKGDTGTTGAKGDPGADGTGVTILGSYATSAALIAAHPTGSPGDAYLVAGDLYVWSATTSSWENVGSIQGPKGDKGDQGDQGIQGVKGDTGLKGDTGNTGTNGTAATIAVGLVTGLAAGATPTINNSGTSGAAVFNFGIPKGDAGTTGTAGVNGAKWFNGTGAPGSVAGSAAGDYYLDTASGDVYVLS